MAAPDAGSILRVPGYLVWNPTDLGLTTGDPPAYGGTLLGTVRDISFRPQIQYRDIWAEEFGSIVDRIYCGEKAILRAVLRHDDADMITQVAARSVASGSSGIRWLFRPGGTTANTRAGTSLFANAGRLLFAARARTAHPFLLLRNAIPLIDEAAELQMQTGLEYGLAVAFLGTPDSSGRVYDAGRRANIAL